MRKQYCEYCGAHMDDGCNCAREAAEYEAELIEELENRPDTQAGWAFQDKLDMMRFER